MVVVAMEFVALGIDFAAAVELVVAMEIVVVAAAEELVVVAGGQLVVVGEELVVLVGREERLAGRGRRHPSAAKRPPDELLPVRVLERKRNVCVFPP